MIISNSKPKAEDPTNFMKKRACITVKRCLVNEICTNYSNYFEINRQTTARTRAQGFILKVLKTRLVKLVFTTLKRMFLIFTNKLFSELILRINLKH